MKILIMNLFLWAGLLQAEGFGVGAVVSMRKDLVPINDCVVGDVTAAGDEIVRVTHSAAGCYIKMEIGDYVVCAAPDQKFYMCGKNMWINACDAALSDVLLCRNGKSIRVNKIEVVYDQCDMYALSIEPSHIFYVTPHEIIVHNMEPVGGAAVAFLSVVCPPAGVALAALEVIAAGAVGIGAYCAYKKHKKQKKTTENLVEKEGSSSCGGSGKDPQDEDDKEKHPYGIYKDASYHHNKSTGRKSPCPKDGQTALDNSVSVSRKESDGRVGISNGEIVVLNKTSERLYHGYVTTWSQLENAGSSTQLIRNTLTQNGLVSKAGKIIKDVVARKI